MAVTLTVPSTGGGRRTYTHDRELSIGRDPAQVEVVLESAYVSRYHCVIRRRLNGDWVLIHRGRNSSRIGDIVLRKPGEQALLPAHTELRVGGVKLLLDIDEADTSSREVVQIEDLDIRDPESGWDIPVPAADFEDEEDDERTILDEEIPDLAELSEVGASETGEEVERSAVESAAVSGVVSGVVSGGETGTGGGVGREVFLRDSEVLPAAGARDGGPVPPVPPGVGASRDLEGFPTSGRRRAHSDIVVFEEGAERYDTGDGGEDEVRPGGGPDQDGGSARPGACERFWQRLKKLFG